MIFLSKSDKNNIKAQNLFTFKALSATISIIINIGDKKMKKSELITLIAEKAGTDNKTAKANVELVLDSIYEALAEGEDVSLAGFGNFEIRERKASRAKNPATGEIIDVPAKKSVAFKATKSLREKLNS